MHEVQVEEHEGRPERGEDPTAVPNELAAARPGAQESQGDDDESQARTGDRVVDPFGDRPHGPEVRSLSERAEVPVVQLPTKQEPGQGL